MTQDIYRGDKDLKQKTRSVGTRKKVNGRIAKQKQYNPE